MLVQLMVVCCETIAAMDPAVVETSRRTSLSQASVTEALKQCDLSQSEMNICAEYRFVREELRLNRFYRELLARREERDVHKLQHAQQTWIRWREANCDYEASEGESNLMLTNGSPRADGTGDLLGMK